MGQDAVKPLLTISPDKRILLGKLLWLRYASIKATKGLPAPLERSAVAWPCLHDVNAVIAACGNGAVEKLGALTVIPPFVLELVDSTMRAQRTKQRALQSCLLLALQSSLPWFPEVAWWSQQAAEQNRNLVESTSCRAKEEPKHSQILGPARVPLLIMECEEHAAAEANVGPSCQKCQANQSFSLPSQEAARTGPSSASQAAEES